MEDSGIEPLTFWMQIRRSTNWTNPPKKCPNCGGRTLLFSSLLLSMSSTFIFFFIQKCRIFVKNCCVFPLTCLDGGNRTHTHFCTSSSYHYSFHYQIGRTRTVNVSLYRNTMVLSTDFTNLSTTCLWSGLYLNHIEILQVRLLQGCSTSIYSPFQLRFLL